MQRSNPILTALCWIWSILIGAYLLWGWYAHSGLYRVLADWQLEQFGKYYVALTLLLPFAVIAGPAISWLGARQAVRDVAAQTSGDPAQTLEARQRRSVKYMLMAAPVFALIAAGAWALAQRQPDGTTTPVPVDIATLGDATPPGNMVTLIGTIDTERATSVATESRSRTTENIYVPVIANGAAGKSAPIRFFLKRPSSYGSEGPTRQMFMGDQSGILVKNGLPPELAQLYQKQGAALADPHYVLTSADGVREPYYIVMGIAGLLAFVLLISAPASLLGIRIRARRERR